MPAPRFHEQRDLELRLGGAKVLKMLTDKDKDGIPDPDLVEAAIDAGCAEIAAIIERTVALAGLQQPYPYLLVLHSSWASAYQAWAMGGEGQAIPDRIVDGYDKALKFAQEVVATRGGALGITPRPALDPPAHQVDPDPCGKGLSVRGFKRGLR